MGLTCCGVNARVVDHVGSLLGFEKPRERAAVHTAVPFYYVSHCTSGCAAILDLDITPYQDKYQQGSQIEKKGKKQWITKYIYSLTICIHWLKNKLKNVDF
jgi:uncharacterized protein YceK